MYNQKVWHIQTAGNIKRDRRILNSLNRPSGLNRVDLAFLLCRMLVGREIDATQLPRRSEEILLKKRIRRCS
jgi:hypothetical protein